MLDTNHILKNLPPLERQFIMPSCELVELHLGETIEEAGRPIQFLHFPIDCAISITNRQDQEHTVEVTVTGKEGCTGATIVLGDGRAPYMALVQISGVAIRIPSSVIIERLATLPFLVAALTRYDLLVMGLAIISVGCSQFHSPAQRLSRWLKAHWHRTGLETFPFSSDFLAAIVGVDSIQVKECLMEFKTQGIVAMGHNTVSITDHDRLERKACRCYSLAKESTEEYVRFLKTLTTSSSSAQEA